MIYGLAVRVSPVEEYRQGHVGPDTSAIIVVAAP